MSSPAGSHSPPAREPCEPYMLSAADVSDLRSSVRWRLHDHGEVAAAWINYSPTDDAFILHAYGHTQAISSDLRVLAACLRCERAETGFIARILDTREDVSLASLAPDLAAEARRRAYDERAKAEAASAARLEAQRRRNSILPTDVSGFDLDDLL